MKKTMLKKSEAKYMAKIPQTEIAEIVSELSGGATALLLYYYSRKDGWIFVEKNIAAFINTSERQVGNYRRELIKKGFLDIKRGELDVYLIGRKAVEQYKDLSKYPTAQGEVALKVVK